MFDVRKKNLTVGIVIFRGMVTSAQFLEVKEKREG